MKSRTAVQLIVTLMIGAIVLPMAALAENNNRLADSDDVQFELVGQVVNPSSTTSNQFGYLTYVNGISEEVPIFRPGTKNESTALLTFYNETQTETVINNGTLRIINRVGRSTIYVNPATIGTFDNPDTFRSGIPIQVSELRHQVVIDTITGAFTTTFVHTITDVNRFQIDGHQFKIGKTGETFRTTVFGHLNSSGMPAAYIAGFATGTNLVRPKD